MEMLVLFLLGLATGVYGDCECQYPDQTYGQPPLNLTTLWIMNAYDTSTGQHCTKSCEIHLNSGNPALGIGDYTQYAWDSSVTGTIDIYNSNASWAQLTPFMPGIHQSYNPPPGFSTGQYLLVVVNTTGTGSVISSLSVGPAATQPPTDPPTTTTPTYTGPYAPLNPALISHDLVIMVDTGKNDPNTAADIKDSQTFTSALVEELSPSVFASPTSDQTRVTGTRLSLYQLNYLNSGPALIPWEVAAADVSNQIKNLFTVPSQRTPYTSAIKQFTDENSPFNVNLNKYQPSRNTAQRTLLVVSTSKPNDLDQLINVDLTTYDIRPLFVAFNFDPTDLDGLNKWRVVRADNTTDVISFVKQYFLSQGAGNHLCSQPPTLQYTASVTGDTFKWPLSFPDGFSSTSTPIYQKNRYCNFQKFSISITSHPDKATCFTVKHETEADKDTLKFYQQNGYSKWVEVVSLSGIDVDGTSFRIANDTRIEFETNESQVFGGFQIQFKICP